MIPEYLQGLLEKSRWTSEFTPALTCEVKRLGELVLPSGKVCANDPFFYSTSFPAFERSVTPGTYPVFLSVASIGASDQRVAGAFIRFRDDDVVSWKVAIQPGQDVSTLGAEEFFGYGVDSGTGSFASPEAVLGWDSDAEALSDQLIRQAEKTYRNTWSTGEVETGGANVLAFTTGWGDGAYASYWGLGADGEPVVLLSDFQVLSEATRVDI